MAKDKRRLPRWLQALVRLAAPAKPGRSHLPFWQESLWGYPQVASAGRLLLLGKLSFGTGEAPETICSEETGVRCSLGRPVVSAQGIHGFHLFLTDQKQAAEVSALLLTPAAHARLQSNLAWENAPTHSLTEPFIAIETGRLRAEFTLQQTIYDPAHPQQEILQGATLEVAVWQLSPEPSR